MKPKMKQSQKTNKQTYKQNENEACKTMKQK